jgi:hypothetical protein
MKKINIVYIVLLTIFFISCDDENENVVILDQLTITDLVGDISVTSSIAAPGYPVGYSLTLPQSFSSDAVVTVKAVVGGTSESIGTITIPAGSTTGDGTISIPNTGALAFGLNNTAKISIKGLALSPAEGDTFTLSSNAVEVLLYDSVQWPYGSGVVAGRATMLFDWEGSTSKDFDTRVFDSATLNLVEDSGTGSRYEFDILNDTHPDGDYFLVVDIFSGSGDTPWKFFFVHPDQTTVEVFEGVFTAAEVASGIVFPVIEWTKSTDVNGNVSYVVTKP